MRIKGVLFDLDGTLVNTAPDIIDAVNAVLSQYKQPNISTESIEPYISQGSIAILANALGYKKNDKRLPHLRQQLFTAYQPLLANKSRLFPGMQAILEHLQKKHHPWGVVTNKPKWLADQVLDKLHIAQDCACVVGPDCVNKRKPHPEPLLYACRLLHLPPESVVYIGDCEHDILATKRAGMPSIAVTWGYYPPGPRPTEWGADAVCKTAAELEKALAEL